MSLIRCLWRGINNPVFYATGGVLQLAFFGWDLYRLNGWAVICNITAVGLYSALFLNVIDGRYMNGNRQATEDHQDRTVEGTPDYSGAGTLTVTLGPIGSAFTIPSPVHGADPGEGEGASEDPELTLIAPVWGFRSWIVGGDSLPRLHAHNGGGAFASMSGPSMGPAWTPGKNVAGCFRPYFYASTTKRPPACVAPGNACSCGFYAVRDVFSVPEGQVGGVVGWGKVIDGEWGWRAQYAAVAALFCPPWIEGKELQKLTFLAHHYNVSLCSTLEDLAAKTQALADWMAGADLLDASHPSHETDAPG